MTSYQTFKRKTFDYEKDALAWAKKIKKQNTGRVMKIDTNYLQDSGKWEGLVLVKNDG